MTRYLVTGGAGFIGSHLVEHLLNEGFETAVLDNFCTGRRENLEPFLGRVDFFEADLRDRDAVRRAVEGVDYILHQAALPSVPRSIEQPLESHEVNVTGTVNLLDAARDAGVKRLVYAASSSAYGDIDAPVKREDMPVNPLSPYGAAKLAGEHYCKAFYHSCGLETVCLRYFNVFGPRQNPYSPYTGVLAIFIPLMLQNKRPTIFGDGSVTRDFTFIQNNVRANMLAAMAPGAAGETFNIATGVSHSLLDLVETINGILGTNLEPEFAPVRKGDIQHSLASIDKAREILGYEPLVDFEEGMRRTVEWYREELKK
ncbi:MAG: SDR family NAD(P)-dependent oxidoreductase [bacterium]|nr:SDR family NAD(P)-dependent oxidoreductase [bacterium]